MRHNGGRREDCVGGGGEGGGGDGGGDEEPSKLRAEKVGWCGLSTLVTWRLPDSEVGDGRWWRGRGGRGSPSEKGGLSSYCFYEVLDTYSTKQFRKI